MREGGEGGDGSGGGGPALAGDGGGGGEVQEGEQVVGGRRVYIYIGSGCSTQVSGVKSFGLQQCVYIYRLILDGIEWNGMEVGSQSQEGIKEPFILLTFLSGIRSWQMTRWSCPITCNPINWPSLYV